MYDRIFLGCSYNNALSFLSHMIFLLLAMTTMLLLGCQSDLQSLVSIKCGDAASLGMEGSLKNFILNTYTWTRSLGVLCFEYIYMD